MNHVFRYINYELPAMDPKLGLIGYKLPAMDPKLGLIGSKLASTVPAMDPQTRVNWLQIS
jgi:hypothetical protein